MGENHYIGIDLGTTNTLVSYFKKDKQYRLKFEGKNVLPSVIYVDPENSNIYVGNEAVSRGSLDPDNRVSSAKTYMATNKKYIFKNSQKEDFMVMTPTDVAAEILKVVKEKFKKKRKLQEDDEIYAVITVPAAFSFQQHEETKYAAEKAGIKVLGLKSEPVAAAISCVNDIEPNSTIFVVDIGGGTFDTAFITFNDKLIPDTLCSEGDRRLGGDDFDSVIFNYMKEQAEDEWGIDLSTVASSELSYQDYYRLISVLKEEAKRAKEELSKPAVDDYEVVCEELFTIKGYNHDQPVSFHKKIRRSVFSKLCSNIYEKIGKRIDESIKAFKEKGNQMKDITHLVLVGGSCYIPDVVELIENKVGMQSVKVTDKTTAVADGAAIIANSWTVFGKELGGVLAQSMGIAERGNIFSKVIGKGEKYPCKKKEIYTTVKDNQETVHIFVYAASPDKETILDLDQHEYYGDFKLSGIEKAAKGIPQIEVTFEFDYNQQLTVTAKDLKTGSEKTVEIQKGAEKGTEGMAKSMSIDLLIDVSGSMAGKELRDAKEACFKVVDDIIDLNYNEVGVTAFSDDSVNICNITNNVEFIKKEISKMKAGGGTRMDRGIKASSQKIQAGKYSEKIIFMVTDGAPNSGDKSETIAKMIREENNIRLVVIFIGEPFTRGYQYAEKVAKANALEEKALFYTSTEMSKLGEIFSTVYADIIAK